jgi:hypothetical protein
MSNIKITHPTSNTDTEFTPIVIIPEFDYISEELTMLQKAIIKIESGLHEGDILELDSNYSVVPNTEHYKIGNTNVYLPEGGFNPLTGQLVLEGEDSVETYNELLESILLDSLNGQHNPHYEISFSVVDTEGKTYHLPKATLDIDSLPLAHDTVFGQIFGAKAVTYFHQDAELPNLSANNYSETSQAYLTQWPVTHNANDFPLDALFNNIAQGITIESGQENYWISELFAQYQEQSEGPIYIDFNQPAVELSLFQQEFPITPDAINYW